MDRKFVIWGVGMQGKNLFKLLGADQTVAFIDSNPDLIGTTYMDKQIISIDDYCKSFKSFFIVISIGIYEHIDNVKQILKEKNISHYFLFAECPQEVRYYMDNTIVPLSKLHIKYEANQSYAIYGVNLFGLLLHDYLTQNGCKDIYLVAHKAMNPLVLEQVKKFFPDLLIRQLDEVKDKICKLFLTVKKDATLFNNNENYIVENAYDYSDRLEENHNKAIEKFKDIHKGKRCFVVCTGPSLKFEDLDILHSNNELCIGMNRIYCGFEDTEWRPDYYACGDINLIESYKDDIANLEIKSKFIAACHSSFWDVKHEDNVYKFYISNEYYDEPPSFSNDFSKVSYGGCTITYNCLQLAVYMGFAEIYLIGLDFDHHISATAPESHFAKNYFDNFIVVNSYKDTTKWFPDYEKMALAYKGARLYAEAHGIKIYNATRGGKLEVFERVSFDGLFPKK